MLAEAVWPAVWAIIKGIPVQGGKLDLITSNTSSNAVIQSLCDAFNNMSMTSVSMLSGNNCFLVCLGN